MQHRSKIVVAAVAAASVVGSLAVSGTMIAVAQKLRYWAYPTFFGLGMLLTGLVLVILLPAAKKKESLSPWLRDHLAGFEKKFSSGSWEKMRSRGSFAFVLAVTFVLGPLAGAVAIRFLGLREDRAWAYAFIANLVSILFWISVYIGVIDALRSAFMSLFAS